MKLFTSQGAPPRLWILWLCGLGFITNLFGFFLYGAPRGPDEIQGAASVLGAFLVFLSYLASLAAWGNCLRRALSRPPRIWEDFFWGTALFALLLNVLGFLPFVGMDAFPFWEAQMLLGFPLTLFLESRWPETGFKALELSRIEKWILFAAGGVFLLTLAAASFPHAFWDSLWYHLTGPRLWFDRGEVFLPEFFPIAFKTGLWDYHFLLPQILLGGDNGTGLIAAQLFGQWLTVASMAFCFWVLFSERKLFGLSALAVFWGVLGSEVFLVARFAKNDGGSCFWGFCFAVFLLESSNPLLVGFAAGLCFAAKYTAAFFLAPLFFWLTWHHRRSLPGLAGGFLLASLPLLLRNYSGTGDPFFPALAGLFPTPYLGPSWQNISVYEGNTLHLAALVHKAIALARDNPVALGFPFLFLVVFRKEKVPPLALSTLASMVAFLIFTGPNAEGRLAGPSLVFFCAFGCMGIETVLRFLPPFAFRPLAIFISALGLYLLPIDWKAPVKFLSWQDPALLVREWISGSAASWIRMNVPSSEGVATLQEQRIYYLLPHAPVRAFDDPVLDQNLHAARDVREAAQVFRKKDIRFLLLSAEFLDLYYDRKICDWFVALAARNPGAVVFRADQSMVLDLSKIVAWN